MSTASVPGVPRFIRSRLQWLLAVVCAIGLAATMMACSRGGGGSDKPFYEGKTIEYLVPLEAGGSTDIATRLFAKYMPKYIPGNPKTVVKNEENGGNSLIAANHYMQDGSKDGTHLLALGGSNHSAFLFGNTQVEYTPGKDLIPLAGTTSGGLMIARADTGLKSAADLKGYDKQLFLGGRRPEGSFFKRALSFQLLGVPVKELLGYEGTSNLDIAFEQGELNVNGVGTPAFFQDNMPKVKSGEQVVLWTEGALDGSGGIVRDPVLPDYPSIAEVYQQLKGAAPGGPEWEAYKVLAAADGGVDKGLYVKDDVPKEQLGILQAAVDKTLGDPEFVKEAKELLGDYPVLNGADFGKLVDANIVNANKDGLTWLKNWARDKYQLDLSEG
jgi:hypothetical protein